MAERDRSPVRKPAPDGHILNAPFVLCRRRSHTPTTNEWFVHKPEGTVSRDPNAQRMVSQYNSMRVEWYADFEFYSDNVVAREPAFLTQKQATERAEDHRLAMNLEHNVGVAHWRYMRPHHVEIKFTKHPVRTVILERSYWEKWRHSCSIWLGSANVKDGLRHLLITGKDPLTGAHISTRTVAKHRIDAPKHVKTYMADGDRLHLCLNNTRVRMSPKRDWPGANLHNQSKVWVELERVGGELYWYVQGFKYFIIPNGTEPNDVPDYVKDSAFTEISVHRDNGYLYWKNTWHDAIRPLLEEEEGWFHVDGYVPKDIEDAIETVRWLWARIRVPHY